MSIDNGHALKDRAYEEGFEDGIAMADEAGKLAERWEASLISDDADEGVDYLDHELYCDNMLEAYSIEDIFKAIMSGDTSEMADKIREKMSDLAGDHLEYIADQNANEQD